MPAENTFESLQLNSNLCVTAKCCLLVGLGHGLSFTQRAQFGFAVLLELRGSKELSVGCGSEELSPGFKIAVMYKLSDARDSRKSSKHSNDGDSIELQRLIYYTQD